MHFYYTIYILKARQIRDQYKNLLLDGKDIVAYKKEVKATKEIDTNALFENAINEWLEKIKSDITPRTKKAFIQE